MAWPKVFNFHFYGILPIRLKIESFDRKYLDRNPSTFLIFQHLDLGVGGLRAFLGGSGGSQSNYIIPAQQIGLSAHVPSLSVYFLPRSMQDFLLSNQKSRLKDSYRNQTESENPRPPIKHIIPTGLSSISERDGHRRQAGEFYAVLCILGSYGIAIWIGGRGLYRFTDEGRRWSGGIMLVLASILALTATIAGGSGCPPWRWYKCLHDYQNHSEYQQTFQHGEPYHSTFP
jgi:hypothetical protein